MAGEFRKLPLKRFPKHLKRKDTVEQKYWKAFEFPTVVKEYTAINYVDFCRVAPYNCLVTCSGKIQIFAPYTNEVKRTYTQNKENVYNARYRSDGKLLVTGGESGSVQVLDVNSRSILRSFKGHTKPTHVCTFGKDNSTIYSASDDKTIRCWDLSTAKETMDIKAHKDYIRTGCINETNSSHFITGSYDHMVKVWDCRMSSVAMEMNHGAPVECILMHQNGSVCLSAGSNYIKVWDILAGGKLFNQFSNHQKTITTIRFDDECKRLFSGSLDRHVKVYDVQDYSIIANIDYPSPILAMDVSKDNNHLTVGMSDGAISLSHRAKPTTETEAPKKRFRAAQPGTYLHRIRNQSSKPDKDDLVIKESRRPKDSKADKCLRHYKYHEALDAVLQKTQMSHTSYVVNVIIELSRRDALEIALSNRDVESLTPIVNFLMRNLANPSYGKILIPVANLLIDMYTSLIGQDKKFDKLLQRLRTRIINDLQNQEEMIKLVGAIEQIFSMASAAPSIDEIECVEVPLNDVPVNDVPLADVPLADVPLADVPLADVPLNDVPLDDVPLDDKLAGSNVVDVEHIDEESSTTIDNASILMNGHDTTLNGVESNDQTVSTDVCNTNGSVLLNLPNGHDLPESVSKSDVADDVDFVVSSSEAE